MRHKTLLFVFLIALLSFQGNDRALAQYRTKSKSDFILKKITVNYRSKGQSGFEGFESRGLSSLEQTAQVGKWAQVEVQYRSNLDWANEVQLDFYVLMSGTVVLKESLTQMNVPGGLHHFAAVYLHPTTLKRFGQIQRVAVLISYRGELQDSDQWPGPTKKEWWNLYPVQTGFLKKVFQTPFLLDQPNRYEDTKW